METFTDVCRSIGEIFLSKFIIDMFNIFVIVTATRNPKDRNFHPKSRLPITNTI